MKYFISVTIQLLAVHEFFSFDKPNLRTSAQCLTMSIQNKFYLSTGATNTYTKHYHDL